MAVAYDAGSQAALSTVNHAAGGANRAAIAAQWFFGSGVTHTGMTSNAVAMTQIGSTLVHPDNTNFKFALFGIVAPSTSSVPYISTYSGGTPALEYLQVVSATGVDQSTPFGTVASSNSVGDQAAVSDTVNSAIDGLVFDFLFAGGTSATAGGSQTPRLSASDWGGNGVQNRVSSAPGAPSVAMDWTLGLAQKWQHFVLPLIPAGGVAGGARNGLLMLGVG